MGPTGTTVGAMPMHPRPLWHAFQRNPGWRQKHDLRDNVRPVRALTDGASVTTIIPAAPAHASKLGLARLGHHCTRRSEARRCSSEMVFRLGAGVGATAAILPRRTRTVEVSSLSVADAPEDASSISSCTSARCVITAPLDRRTSTAICSRPSLVAMASRSPAAESASDHTPPVSEQGTWKPRLAPGTHVVGSTRSRLLSHATTKKEMASDALPEAGTHACAHSMSVTQPMLA
eukprot:scaffold161439_cov25-Tisochrysis_lutea.AAC.3